MDRKLTIWDLIDAANLTLFGFKIFNFAFVFMYGAQRSDHDVLTQYFPYYALVNAHSQTLAQNMSALNCAFLTTKIFKFFQLVEYQDMVYRWLVKVCEPFCCRFGDPKYVTYAFPFLKCRQVSTCSTFLCFLCW